MIVHIHNNTERWSAIRPLLIYKPHTAYQRSLQNREMQDRRFGLSEVLNIAQNENIIPEQFYDQLDHKQKETIGAYNPSARIPQKKALFIGKQKIQSSINTIIPGHAKGDEFRENLGRYVFMNRHEIANAKLIHEITHPNQTRHATQYNPNLEHTLIGRHQKMAQKIILDTWQKNQNTPGRLPDNEAQSYLKQIQPANMRQLAKGFIEYETALGFVMPHQYDNQFKDLPNERNIPIKGLTDDTTRQAVLDWAAFEKHEKIKNKSHYEIGGKVYAADQAGPLEIMGERWLNPQRSGPNKENDVEQDKEIRSLAPRPLITGWTRQGTLEVGVYDKDKDRINYHYISHLELRGPVDIHADGKGGISLNSRKQRLISKEEVEIFDLPQEKRSLHPVLKELSQPTLAKNQPEYDFIYNDGPMKRTLSKLKSHSSVILSEMDLDQEVSSGVIRKHQNVEKKNADGSTREAKNYMTETGKITGFLNYSLRRQSKERGIRFEPVSVEDVVFTARVLEAEKRGLTSPAVKDWSEKETELLPSRFAATNINPAYKSDVNNINQSIGGEVRLALYQARQKVQAGAKFLFENNDDNKALIHAQEKIRERYKPNETKEKFTDLVEENFKRLSKVSSHSADQVHRREEIENKHKNEHSRNDSSAPTLEPPAKRRRLNERVRTRHDSHSY